MNRALALWGCLALLMLTGCAGRFPSSMSPEGYSSGPVSAPEFPALVRAAVPADAGDLHVFGRGSWHGFDHQQGVMHWTDPYFAGVVVLADRQILLLLWDEREGVYQVEEQVPYSAIRLRSSDPDSTGYLEIDLGGRALTVGSNTFRSRMPTYLGFENATGSRIDRARNREAHRLLGEKVVHAPAREAHPVETENREDQRP